MRFTITAILVFYHLFLLAQDDITISTDRGDNQEILVYAENTAPYEQSVKLELTLKGMTSSVNTPIIKVLPPKSKAYLVTLTPEPNKGYSYKYEYTYIAGDVTGTHNDDFIYQLPYTRGKSYRIGQSYLERPTHMSQNAVDFNMDEGTEITAVRDGIVTRVVEKFNRGCPREECSAYNNFVLVKHEDGSVADYSHLQKNGALVKIGDRVKAGDPIALSGSTGWATGPHLHFEVYVMTFEGQRSIPIKYHLSKDKVGIPRSGESYVQEY